MKIFGMIILIIICIGAYVLIHKGHEKDIKEWAIENKYTIESCDNTLFDWGPFNYCGKGNEIFKVKVLTSDNQHKTFYFRFGWSTEIEEYNK